MRRARPSGRARVHAGLMAFGCEGVLLRISELMFVEAVRQGESPTLASGPYSSVQSTPTCSRRPCQRGAPASLAKPRPVFELSFGNL